MGKRYGYWGLKAFARIGLLAVFLLSVLITASPAKVAAVNEEINFQGRLYTAEGATVPDGFYNIQFKIYRDGDGQSAGNTTGSPAGTLLWTESHLRNNSQGVRLKNGFMSVQLGSITAFGSSVDWDEDTLWLSMNVAGTNATCTPFSSCTPDGEMLPMKRLSSVPSALNSSQLGGITSDGFVQIGPTSVQLDATNNNTLYINKTGTGNLALFQDSGADAFAIGNTGDITFGANVDHSIAVAGAAAGTAGKALTISGGNAGTTGSGLDGGNLVLQGGTGSGTGTSGSVIVKANSSDSTAVFQVQDAGGASVFNVDSDGRVIGIGDGSSQPVPNLDEPTSSDTGGSIANATTYYYGITAVYAGGETEISPIVSHTVDSLTNTNTISLEWTVSTGATGYKIYRNTSNSFTSGTLLLTTIGSGATTTYTDTGTSTTSGVPPAAYSPTVFRVDSAANAPFGTGQVTQLGAMYYNTSLGEFQCYKDTGVGGAWADCGVTTLQGAYDNIDDDSNDPTIKLDADRGAFMIQDANSTIGANLLEVRASNGSGLGAVMFSVGSTGAVTIRNATDQNTAWTLQNQAGAYLANANTNTGYFINNGTKALSDRLENPGFESGGNITGGEQGWNGPAQASINNGASDSHRGNHYLEITPNGTNLKTYAGTYFSASPGDVISFEGWVKNTSGTNGTGGVIIEAYDKDKALLASSSDASLPGTSYVLRRVRYTAPANTVYVRVAAYVTSGANTGFYHFDDFSLSGTERGQVLFQNTSNSSTAFVIQSASAGQTLFTANTTDNILKIGDSTGSDTSTTILVVDSATADPTTSLASRNGGLFYRSDTNSLKAVIGGAVYDICTTAVTCTGYAASASSSIQLQASTPGVAQTGNFNISGTGILTQLQTQDQSASSTNSSNLVIRTGNATGSTSNSGNLTLDVGTATGTLGTITIGHTGVATTMPGTLKVQGANALELGSSATNTGLIRLYNNVGSNYVQIAAAGANPTSSWSFTLPQDPSSASGYCLKATDTAGTVGFSDCGAGITVTLQDTYNNSSSPATITLANAKDLLFTAQETTTDPSVLVNLQCTTCSSNGGRFAIQNGGTDVFTVRPNGGGIVLAASTQVGSGTTDATQVNLQLDSYNQSNDSGSCTTTTNQGAMYYNTFMGSIRSCINGTWSDLSNPDTMGLMSFGIVPSSGANPYDLPSLVVAGASGPCKVSWASSTSVAVEACVAYSNGRRINVNATTLSTNSATTNNINLTTTNRWGHVCLTGANNQPAFTSTSGTSTPTANMPSFSISQPILCLADVVGSSTSAGQIDDIYDVRTFTSTLKEAINLTTAAELGMLVDSGTSGLVPAASCTSGTCSGKLYAVVVATDGSTSSSAPNGIVATVGPSYVKVSSGSSGQFIKSGATTGYGTTVAAIPNNAFYFSPGNARTSFSTTCSSASNCQGSLYVNFIVR